MSELSTPETVMMEPLGKAAPTSVQGPFTELLVMVLTPVPVEKRKYFPSDLRWIIEGS